MTDLKSITRWAEKDGIQIRAAQRARLKLLKQKQEKNPNAMLGFMPKKTMCLLTEGDWKEIKKFMKKK